MIYVISCECYVTLTDVQFNFPAAISGSVCEVNDHSGRSCQQNLVRCITFLTLLCRAVLLYVKMSLYLAESVFARDSIYAIARICYRPSVCLSVCLSVCHMGGSVKNAWS